MQIDQIAELSEHELFLAFAQEVYGGYAEGVQSPDFDHRGFLASIVVQAYCLYVMYELKPTIGGC